MLTPDQLTALDYHLRQINRLTNEELIQELTDHYAIALSERMAQGVPFGAALTDVTSGFGGRKGLQRMERQYNRITYRRYDGLWMQYVREEISWPRGLLPLCLFGLSYLMLTTTGRPTPVSTDLLFHNPWSGLVLGAILGLLINIARLTFLSGIRGRNFPYKATYLAIRALPITIVLYGMCLLLTYLSVYLVPSVYAVILSACVAMIMVYMLSYGRFYKDVLKESPRVD